MDPKQNYPAHCADVTKHLWYLAWLHLDSQQKKSCTDVPASHNHRENMSNLKITQYGFRSSLKIWYSFLNWTQMLIPCFNAI
jgi:hypothetical protein